MSGLGKARPYGKGPASSLLRPPLSTPESFSSGSSGPGQGRRNPYIDLSGLKVHRPESQEHSSSHRPSAPTALSGGLRTHVGAVPRLQLEFVAETGRGPYQEPSQAADIPARRQPRENSRREEEAWSPGHIPTPQRPADSTTGTFH